MAVKLVGIETNRKPQISSGQLEEYNEGSYELPEEFVASVCKAERSVERVGGHA